MNQILQTRHYESEIEILHESLAPINQLLQIVIKFSLFLANKLSFIWVVALISR